MYDVKERGGGERDEERRVGEKERGEGGGRAPQSSVAADGRLARGLTTLGGRLYTVSGARYCNAPPADRAVVTHTHTCMFQTKT